MRCGNFDALRIRAEIQNLAAPCRKPWKDSRKAGRQNRASWQNVFVAGLARSAICYGVRDACRSSSQRGLGPKVTRGSAAMRAMRRFPIAGRVKRPGSAHAVRENAMGLPGRTGSNGPAKPVGDRNRTRSRSGRELGVLQRRQATVAVKCRFRRPVCGGAESQWG